MSTVLSNGTRRYGCWAGNPKGHAEDPKCCIREIFPPGRGEMHRQCNKKRGHGPDGLYCKKHNPEAVAKAQQAAATANKTREQEQDEIVKEGDRLAGLLGAGYVYYHSAARLKDCGYQRFLVVPFDVVKRLLGQSAETETP